MTTRQRMLKETVRRQLPKRKEKEIERKTKTSKETMQMLQLEKEGMVVKRANYLGDSLMWRPYQTMTLAQLILSKSVTRICKIKDLTPTTFRSHRATKAICLIEVRQEIQARIRRKFEITI